MCVFCVTTAKVCVASAESRYGDVVGDALGAAVVGEAASDAGRARQEYGLLCRPIAVQRRVLCENRRSLAEAGDCGYGARASAERHLHLYCLYSSIIQH